MAERSRWRGNWRVGRPKRSRPSREISDLAPGLDKGSALDLEMDVEALLFSRTERKEQMAQFMETLKNRKKR